MLVDADNFLSLFSLLRVSLACSARTTSLRSYSSFIGSRSANESSSSTPCWFSRRCTACCRRISRMTVSCSPIPGAVNSDRLTLRLVLSCGLTRLSAIVVSLWLDREHGTVCLSNCDNQTLALNNLGGYLRRICLAKDYGA